MKNIIFTEWKSLGNEDVCSIFENSGYHIFKIFADKKTITKENVMAQVEKASKSREIEFVFSFNYFPEISMVCNELGLKYVSWVYDSPHIAVYSYTVVNPCNYIFLFDYAVYEELHSGGIQTVYYLPLAVNDKRMVQMRKNMSSYGKFSSDISFVGSMYSEKKHRLYDRFENIDPFAKGYLDGIIQAQKNIYGSFILQDLLNDDIIAEMEKAYPTDPNALTALTPRAIYADYVLARQVTALERQEILELLGGSFHVDLYTHEKEVAIPGVRNRGVADYYNDMPYVFMNSKINLNITLRSIKTGIPLRALDIMGAGGFLLSNYQPEYDEYFTIGEDMEIYSDYEDLMGKTEYYLTHEKERTDIARNGMEKVWREHNMEGRLKTIIKTVNGED